jgi:hypothetical protein
MNVANTVGAKLSVGGSTPLPNDNGLGTPIRAEHYDLWRACWLVNIEDGSRGGNESPGLRERSKHGGEQPLHNSGRSNHQQPFSSAHDLRRAFGLRWSSRVMPQILMQLMRR